jgi:hypothetical protein
VKVYVVIGTTGEYSDCTEWFVKGYRDEERAKAEVVELCRLAKSFEVLHPWPDRGWRRVECGHDECAALYAKDPNVRFDYTGTDYRYEPVEVVK